MSEKVAFPIGLKIVGIRLMTEQEVNNEGWDYNYEQCYVLELSDGSILYPSMDGEGNGPGVMFGLTKDSIPVYISPLTDDMILESELPKDR